MTLTHGGLFEGYGGTTMAAEAVLGPLDTRWVSDIKPASVALLRHRHPGVPNLGDMTVIDYAAVEPVDVLTASWPCQAHSSAGKRLGEKDPRALWPHVARAVETLRPRVFLGENVARITSNGELRRVVRSLAEVGYVGAWRCLTASDVGAPHKRDRCFVVAVDAATDALGLLVRDQPGWRGGPGGAGAGVAGHDGAQGPAGLTLLPTPTTADSDRSSVRYVRGNPTLIGALLPTPTVNDSRGGRNATANRSPGQEHHHIGWTLTDVAYASRWGEYAPAIERWERVFGRPAPDPVQPNERTGKPQLSPAFTEWMMGLPEGWVCDVPDLAPRPAGQRNAALSLLGDGVVPQQGAAAFRSLLDHLGNRLAVAA